MQWDAAVRAVEAKRAAGQISGQDEALVAAVLGLATALDAYPARATLWREYLSALQQLAAVGGERETDAFAELLAELPRWQTPRRPERKTLGPRIAAIAAKFGQPFMPWQELVTNVGFELRPDGRLQYRRVIASVPRQCGKTTMLLAWEIDRALGWGVRHRVIYSAQTGKDAREKLLEDQVPILHGSPFRAAIENVHKTNGSEAILFRGGSRISVLTGTDESGHGKTIGLGVIDEAWKDVDAAREQSLLPAMRTVPNAQLVIASTMGTDASLYLNAIVDGGRVLAETADPDARTAYFEWSAPDDADPGDPATWWACTPALGYTIEEETIAAEYETAVAEGKLGEFRRASLNQRTPSAERVIPAAAWEQVCSADVVAQAPFVLGVDCTPDQAHSSIALADRTGRVELGHNEPGFGWVVSRTIEVARRHRSAVALDPAGPAGSAQEDLERAGVTVIPVTGRDMAKACGDFYRQVIDGTCSIRTSAALSTAVGAVTKRVSGDTWTWARKGQADISPLVAVTAALWAAQQVRGTPHVWNLDRLLVD